MWKPFFCSRYRAVLCLTCGIAYVYKKIEDDMITHTGLLKTFFFFSTDSVVEVTHEANCCHKRYCHQRHRRLKI